MGLFGMVLSVVVAAIILLGLFQLYGSLTTNARTQEAMSRVGTIESETRRSHMNLPSYQGSLEEGLWSALPSGAIQGTGSSRVIVTPWGGTITVGGGASPGTDGTGTSARNRFWVRIAELPEEACQVIAKAHLNRSGVVSIKPGGGSNITNPNQDNRLADHRDAIDTGCNAQDNNTVDIVFRG